MTIQRFGNQTIINIERQREINNILDSLDEDDPKCRPLLDELKELSVWHGDTVPEHVYHATVFQDKIVPAQVKYIQANTHKTASQLMPELKRIAAKLTSTMPELKYPEYE